MEQQPIQSAMYYLDLERDSIVNQFLMSNYAGFFSGLITPMKPISTVILNFQQTKYNFRTTHTCSLVLNTHKMVQPPIRHFFNFDI